MQMFVISDNNDTLAGMRLSGVNGVVLHERSEVEAELDLLYSNKEIGIILITKKLSDLTSDLIEEKKKKHQMPLILEIPDRRAGGSH